MSPRETEWHGELLGEVNRVLKNKQPGRKDPRQGRGRAKAGAAQATAAATQAKAQAILLQELALQAKEQFTPLAKSAQLTASQGVQQARSWAAPRIEQAGVAVQEQIAPKVSSAMIATARRIQPVPPGAAAAGRSSWPGS